MAEKIKLSTTAKKVVNLINQTISGIYRDAVALRNRKWFPEQNQTKPISSLIFKNKIANEADNIIKQMGGNLSAEDETVIRQVSAQLIGQVGNDYAKIVDNNGTQAGYTPDYAYDEDPYSQEVGTQRFNNKIYPVYASFMAGRNQGTNVSGYAGTNNTYSMCDIVCTIDIASNTGSHIVTTLGKLQTLSYSIYQQKQPVRCLGNMNAKDYVYGQRTIAGSLVFAVFNRHWLVDIYDQLVDKGMMRNWHYIADEIPPFDITISFANEYGYDSKMVLYGVRLMTEGQVMSINDIYIENTYQFVATDIEYMDSLNAWQRTDKINRRWQNTPAAGIIASNAARLREIAKKAAEQAKLKGKQIEDNTGSEDDTNSSTNKESQQKLEALKNKYEQDKRTLEQQLEDAKEVVEDAENMYGYDSAEANKAREDLAAVQNTIDSQMYELAQQYESDKNKINSESNLNTTANPTVQQNTLLNHTEDKIKNTPKADALAELYQTYQKQTEELEQELQIAKNAANGDEDEIADAQELYEAKLQDLSQQYMQEYEKIEQLYPDTINGKQSNYNIGQKEENAENALRILKGDTIYDPNDPGNIPVTPLQEEGNQKALQIADEFKDSLDEVHEWLDTTNDQITKTEQQNKSNLADEAIYNLQETIVNYHELVNQQEEGKVDDNVKKWYEQLDNIANSPISNEEKLSSLKEYIQSNLYGTENQEKVNQDALNNAAQFQDSLNNIYDRLDIETQNAEDQREQARKNALSKAIDNAIEAASAYKDNVIQWLQDTHGNVSEEEIVSPEVSDWFNDLDTAATNYSLSDEIEKAYQQGHLLYTEKTQEDIDRIFTTEDTQGLSIGTYTPETLDGQTEKGLLDILKVKYESAKEDIATGAAASVVLSNPVLSASLGSHFVAKQNLLDKCFDNESSHIKQWFAERASNAYANIDTQYEGLQSDTDFEYDISIPSISADNELGQRITDSYLANTTQEEIVNDLTKDLETKRQEILSNNEDTSIGISSIPKAIASQYRNLSKDFMETENAIREKFGLERRSEITDLYDQYEDDISQHYQVLDPSDPDNQKVLTPATKFINNMRELMEPNYNIPTNPEGVAQYKDKDGTIHGAGTGPLKPQRFSLDGGDTLGWGYGENKTTCITSCAIACPGTFLNPNGYNYVMNTDTAQELAKAAGAYVRYGEGDKYTWNSVSQDQLNHMYRPQPGDVVIVSTGDYQNGGHAMMVMEDGQHLIHTGSGISSYIDLDGKYVDALDIIERNKTYQKEHNGADSPEYIANLRRTGIDPHLTVDMLMTYKTGNSKNFEKEGDRYLIACLQTSKYTDNVDMTKDSRLTALRRLKVK